MNPVYPTDKTPPNAQHLARIVSHAQRLKGVPEKRLRRWISSIVLLGALGRVQSGKDKNIPRLILKGGATMELRLKLEARASKDVDLIFLRVLGIVA